VRRFGSVAALAGAEFVAHAGEVHALLGENGAGKSTLLGILGGLLRPDEGRLEIGGVPVALRSAREARTRGIGLVHQHFALVPALTVLENLALGRTVGRGGWRLPLERVRADAEALGRRTGLDVPLHTPVGSLGVGERQRAEILKALLSDPPILALDEPTAVLAPSEVEALFGLLRDLAREGRTVILVAHKIDEVLRVADRVTVLRNGRTILSATRDEVDARTLVRAMVGSDFETRARVPWSTWSGVANLGGASAATGEATFGEEVATLENVRVAGDRAGGDPARARLEGVSLSVRRGEIVGVAGIEGNGQRELALLLAGRLVPDEGTARVPGRIGLVPQDRSHEGLILDFDLVENVALALHRNADYGRGPFLRWPKVRARAEEIRSRFEVRAPHVRTRARSLSGGNQQRLVVGRELSLLPDLFVAENPTRGLDVAATSFVHSELVRLARGQAGSAVVVISTDLDEVLALADRVLVMFRGRLIPVDPAARSREAVGALMLGGTHAMA
jgi:simple sugar transport system ATP-binding protein